MAVSLRDPQDGDLTELSEINVTPFIDVMLVLLIIFMVAAPLSTVDIAVDLPVSSAPRWKRRYSRRISTRYGWVSERFCACRRSISEPRRS